MEDFKGNFITAEVEKPLAELQELTNLVKKKKAEVKKAMFYAKHPDLLEAKKEYDAKMAVANVDKFNETIASSSSPAPEPKEEVKVKVKEEPAPAPVHKKADTAPTPAPIAAKPISVPSVPVTQHAHKPIIAGLNGKWF